MSREIKTTSPLATVAEARNLMRLSGVHHLLVMSENRVVGVVSDRDLGRPIADRLPANGAIAVEAVMTRDLVTAGPDTTIREAANMLRGRHIGSLAILAGSKPVGIVTNTDLLELIGRGAERPVERARRWTLRGRGARGNRPAARHERESP
jgi:acetoin utilization protein AcuB